MKLKSTGTGKKIAGIVIASALVVGSLGTAAALAANSGDAVPKDTVISAPAVLSPSNTAAVTQGTIEYSKDIYARTDGSQNFEMERWYDPATKNMRSDLKEYTADHQLTRYQSTYYDDDLIIIQRDLASGAPESGTIMMRTDQQFIFEKLDAYRGFDSAKDYMTSGRWTSIGTEQTADGKTLNKLLADSYQSYINDTTQANMQLIEFVDQDTGLPVREELYEDSTGQYLLFSSDTNEYKYVTDDGTIFSTEGVTLIPAPAPDAAVSPAPSPAN